jgi:predicted nucleic acid-binding protein
MPYLIDSDVLIDYWRQHAPTVTLLEQLERESGGVLSISLITVAEAFAGASTRNAHVRSIVEAVLQHMRILAPTYDIAVRAGELRRDHSLAITDALIAATALAHSLTLITRNMKHYQNVPDLALRTPA